MSQLIIDFLVSSRNLSDSDVDRLTCLVIALRQKRLGMAPLKVEDVKGRVIFEINVPELYEYFNINEVDTEHAREVFAHFIAPLVSDRFVSRFEHDMAMIKSDISGKINVIEAIMEERGRHII